MKKNACVQKRLREFSKALQVVRNRRAAACHGDADPRPPVRARRPSVVSGTGEALRIYDDALALYPGDYALTLEKGHTLLAAGRPREARQALLHFVVVGANFTGVEVAGEFVAYLKQASARYPNVNAEDCRVTLVEIADEGERRRRAAALGLRRGTTRDWERSGRWARAPASGAGR